MFVMPRGRDTSLPLIAKYRDIETSGWDGVHLWEETDCHNQDGDKTNQLGKWLAQIRFMLWIISAFFFHSYLPAIC